MRFKVDNRGFTLIEILVAICLFLVGAIAVARMQVTSVKGTTFGKEALIATTAVQQLIEQLKERALQGNFTTVLNGSNGALPACSGGLTVPLAATCTAAAGQPGAPPLIPDMTIQWTASSTAGQPAGSRYTTVTVTVLWEGNQRQFQASTVISELQDL